MKCPSCNSQNIISVYKYNDSFSSINYKIKIDINICNNCNFVFLLNGYFDKEYNKVLDKVYKNFNKNFIFSFPKQTKNIVNAINILSPYINKKSTLLEIGSNRGDLLYLLKEKFPTINILGIEPMANSKVYVPTISSTFNSDLISSKFDIIIIQQVLEHIKYPKKIIKDIYKILEKNGIVYIEVPSVIYSLEHKIDDFMLEHVNYFSKESLLDILQDFDILYIEDNLNITVVAQKTSMSMYTKEYLNSEANLRKGFKLFKYKKDEIINQIVNIFIPLKKRIIYYGVSYFYFRIYMYINTTNVEINQYFMDDNYQENIEPINNLHRINLIKDDDVIILCSNDPHVQNKMLTNIRNKNITIVKPWNEIIYL